MISGTEKEGGILRVEERTFAYAEVRLHLVSIFHTYVLMYYFTIRLCGKRRFQEMRFMFSFSFFGKSIPRESSIRC